MVNEIAKNIKEFRRISGWNKRKVATDINVPYTVYLRYESGVATPTIDVIIKIADYYDIFIDELVGRKMY